jgi:coproporphyrinogen III oxidase
MPPLSDADKARAAFIDLQLNICDQLLEVDSKCKIKEDDWEREEGGGGITRAFAKGDALEKGGVNFSDVQGKKLPPSATANRPELEGLPFRATGVSVVFHPYNPYSPTTHANIRYFEIGPEGAPEAWWFGGGFDLTPYYPFHEDVIEWHEAARSVCAPYGQDLYPKFKALCDKYFFLPHRNETRGVGGLFFDDLDLGGFDKTLEFVLKVGQVFAQTYFQIFERRRTTPFGQHQRNFQKYRRGRYAEFNLVYDRGTLFGLQSGGRTESILMSMPPEVSWTYDWKPESGSAEEELYTSYLHPRNWLEEKL